MQNENFRGEQKKILNTFECITKYTNRHQLTQYKTASFKKTPLPVQECLIEEKISLHLLFCRLQNARRNSFVFFYGIMELKIDRLLTQN